MKVKSILKILSLSLFILVSCDEAEEIIDELTEIDFTETVSRTFTVDLPDDSEGEIVNWSESTTIDITSNPEIEDNLDLIKDITINSLTYEIDNFSGVMDAVVTEAFFEFNGNSISIENINLSDSDENNTVYSITDTNLLNQIGDALQTEPEITVSLGGTVSATPVRFDVILNLETTVTAELL